MLLGNRARGLTPSPQHKHPPTHTYTTAPAFPPRALSSCGRPHLPPANAASGHTVPNRAGTASTPMQLLILHVPSGSPVKRRPPRPPSLVRTLRCPGRRRPSDPGRSRSHPRGASRPWGRQLVQLEQLQGGDEQGQDDHHRAVLHEVPVQGERALADGCRGRRVCGRSRSRPRSSRHR